MSFSMSFSRLHGEPCLSGRLRESPQDFLVAEQLGFEPCGHGEHVYLYVRKTGANTAWAAGQIARLAGVRRSAVGYAGRKDRHAITEQWFSCHLPGRLEPAWRELTPAGIDVLRSRRHTKKLRVGVHAANRFRLVVRNLAADGAIETALEDFSRRIDAIGRDGFPNYFGEQRFGHQGNNLARADELFKGRRFARDKRNLYISAARSYLFNRELSRCVADGSWREGDGWLRGLARVAMPPLDDATLTHWCSGLEALGVKAMRRPMRVMPARLDVETREDSIALSFDLPAGSYATSLVRELISYRVPVKTTGESCGQVA